MGKWLSLLSILLFPFQSLAAGASIEIQVSHGIALLNAGDYPQALDELEAALEGDPENGEALFYAGVAASRLGRSGEAESFLRRALAAGETAEANLELGRVLAAAGRCEEAKRHFQRFEALGGDPSGRRAAAAAVGECGGGRAGPPLRASLTCGWQHDSNVILEPENPVAPQDRKADDRLLAQLAVGAGVVRTESASIDVGYVLYASLHGSLNDYDAVTHSLRPVLTLSPGERTRLTLAGSLDFTEFGGSRYSRVERASAAISRRGGSRKTATEAFGEVRDARYWDSELFPDNSERTGGGMGAGLRQWFGGGPFEALLSASLDRDLAQTPWWTSDALKLEGKLVWRPAPPLTLGLSIAHEARGYDAPFPWLGEAREDRRWDVGATAVWALSPKLSLAVSAARSRNESNLEVYRYSRTIVGAHLTLALGR